MLSEPMLTCKKKAVFHFDGPYSVLHPNNMAIALNNVPNEKRFVH